MMKRILLGACAVMVLAGIASAQTANTTSPPPAQDQQADNSDYQGGGWLASHRGGGRHGGKHGGMDGGPGMRMAGKGFALMVGGGHRLQVNCGNEPIKDCIASAQPLIDSLGKLDFKMPPPPAGAPAPAQ